MYEIFTLVIYSDGVLKTEVVDSIFVCTGGLTRIIQLLWCQMSN